MIFALTLLGLTGCPAPAPAGDPTAPTATTPAGCGTGEIFDGEACVPEACGPAPWGTISGDADTVYVAAGATGGDGSAAAPLSGVQAGMDLAASRGGGQVLLAAGTYVENLVLGDDHRDITLVGRCRARVTLDGSAGDVSPTVTLFGDRRRPAVTMSGLTVRGGTAVGIWADRAELHLTEVDLRENVAIGLLLMDSTATLEDLGVYDTRSDADGDYGRGIDSGVGATVTCTRCEVAGNRGVGVTAFDAGTSLTLVDSVVRDTLPTEAGADGVGVLGRGGATVGLTRVTVEANTVVGVFAGDVSTEVTLEDVFVRGTRPNDRDRYGWGVHVEAGAHLQMTRGAVTGNTELGVFGGDEGTVVDLVDVAVADTLPREDGSDGRGVVVQAGARLAATGVHVTGNRAIGVQVAEAGTEATLVDTRVESTHPGRDGAFGRGVEVQGGAHLSAEGLEIVDNTEIGFVLTDAGSTAELLEAHVEGTRRGAVNGFGVGMSVQGDATLDVSGGLVTGTEGAGLYVVSGGVFTARGLTLDDNRFAGLLLLHGTATLEDVRVTNTQADAQWGGGIGVFTSAGFGPPTLALDAVEVGPHPYAAVWLDGPGTYTIAGSSLSGGEGILLGTWPAHGNALVAKGGVGAWDGTTGLLLTDTALGGATQVAVLLHDASASLEGNTWTDNTLDLVQQHCEGGATPVSDEQLADVPRWELCPAYDLLMDFNLDFSTLYLAESKALP